MTTRGRNQRQPQEQSRPTITLSLPGWFEVGRQSNGDLPQLQWQPGVKDGRDDDQNSATERPVRINRFTL
jgi:hypothetical protein